MRRSARYALVFVLVLLPRLAAGQCYESDLCARVNGDVEVFVAKVMTPIDDDGAIRTHVTTRYKGRVRGDVRIVVVPAGTTDRPAYEIGQSFLFYAWRQIDGAGEVLVSRTCNGGAQPFTRSHGTSWTSWSGSGLTAQDKSAA